MDNLDFIIAYEAGEVTQEQMIEGFQALIDSGLAWQLQGHYGRAAMALIKDGECTLPTRRKQS